MPIDWDDLELALTMHSDEHASYLDLRTGEVRLSPIHSFGGEPEDGVLSEDKVEAGLAVEPLESSVEYGWMAEFADTLPDARVRQSLQQALGGSRPFRRFKDALASDPRECEQWFAFQADRLRAAMLEWLSDNDIEPTTAPPRRPGDAAPSGAP